MKKNYEQLRGFYQGAHISSCPQCQKKLEETLTKIVTACPDVRGQLRDMLGK